MRRNTGIEVRVLEEGYLAIKRRGHSIQWTLRGVLRTPHALLVNVAASFNKVRRKKFWVRCQEDEREEKEDDDNGKTKKSDQDGSPFVAENKKRRKKLQKKQRKLKRLRR